MQLTKHYIEGDGGPIPIMELQPDVEATPAGIVMLPGMGGDKYQILENMARLAEHGFATVSLDGPELGERVTPKGKPSVENDGLGYIDRYMEIQLQYGRDFRTVLGWWIDTGRVDPDRMGAWGRSYGAMTLYLALQGERRVRAAAIVIGSPDFLASRRVTLTTSLGSEAEADRYLGPEIVARYRPLTAIDNVEKFAHLNLLALFGGKDTTVPPCGIEEFAAKWDAVKGPKGTLQQTLHGDAPHRATPEMEREWTAWFKKYLA